MTDQPPEQSIGGNGRAGQGGVNVAVVGLGLFGQLHLRTYLGLADVHIAAVCDANERLASDTATRYGVPYYSSSLERLLEERPDVQALSIVTPEHLHLEHCTLALGRGKHLLVEKPLATSTDSALQIVAARHDAILLVGHLLRFDTRYLAAKRAVEKGELGEVRILTSKRNANRGMANQYRRVHLAFLNMIHDVDLALWYLGGRVRAVQARQMHLHSRSDDPPDFLSATLEFESGSMAVLESGYLWPDKAAGRIDISTRIYGTEGVAEINSPSNSLRLSLDSEERNEDPLLWHDAHGYPGGALGGELRYFIECVRNSTPPERITPEEAVEAVRVAEAVQRAATSGVRVEL